MFEGKRPDFQFDVFVYRDDDGEWLAHCLQLDLVEEGASPDAAFLNVKDVIRAHVQYAIEHDNLEHLFHPAPVEVWRAFTNCATFIRRDTFPLEVEDDDDGRSILIQESAQYALA